MADENNGLNGIGGFSIFEDLYDQGKNIFNRVIDFKLQSYEAEKLLELRSLENQADNSRQSAYSEDAAQNYYYPYSGSVQSISVTQIMAIAALGIGALIVAR